MMTREAFELGGMKHVKEDEEVGNEPMSEAQWEINGNVAMTIKMFKVGKMWNYIDRVRETMLREGITACPVSLLFEDHKN